MDLYIIGCGGHGKVVYDLAQQLNKYEYIYFLDDKSIDTSVIGKPDEYKKHQNDEFYIAFGDNKLRYKWYQKLKKDNIKLATIIHPTAYISKTANIGVGCLIMPYSIINTDTVIKDCCIINVGAIVDHNCIVNECCHVSAGGIVKAYNNVPSKLKVESGEVIPLNYYK